MRSAEHWATFQRTISSREGRKPVQLTGARQSGMGQTGLEYVYMFLSFLLCNVMVICPFDGICVPFDGICVPFDGICVQRPSFVLRCPLLFLTFPLAGSPEPALGSPPAPHHNRPQNCKNFFLNGGQSFIHEEGKL